MSYYFREKPKFDENVSDREEDFMQKFKQHFDDDKSFFERPRRDPFERHASFSRGFPFDDEGFGRRDIRAHLDDLAARHPEFAEHLLGSPWGEVPFSGTRTRSSGPPNQNYQDEDARSQASGSSAASAASGASGVSSHGEPEPIFEGSQAKIPQYGLRNTVDIGQQQLNMQNQDKGSRGQRSMSAPPENRQDAEDNQRPQQDNHQSQNPRFVSRVDITPQFNNQATEKSSKPQSQPQPHPQKQQTSNVRHIPIFVEGRDKPVIPKDVDESSAFTKQPSPPKFHPSHFETATTPPPPPPPPHFHRPSHFTSERGFGGRPREWTQFHQDPFQNPFDYGTRRTQSPFRQQTERHSKVPESHFPQGQSNYPQPSHSQSSHPPHHHHHQQQQQQQHQHQPQSEPQSQQEPTAESSKPKPVVLPKDPLERVALVQKEVDSLTEQVKLWNGNSRKDKQYIYLDEMLTRELIKLDDIETEGKEAVRQTRKNAIKSIQDSISLLESKAPLPGQTPTREELPQLEQSISEDKEQENVESMDTEKKPEDEDKPIPLPAAPSSPTKESSDFKNESRIDLQQSKIEEPEKMEENLTLPDPHIAIPMEPSPPVESSTAMEVQTEIEKTTANEERKNGEQNEKIKSEETSKVLKSPKKVKKTKKQVPVSSEPIPLPGPEVHHTDVE